MDNRDNKVSNAYHNMLCVLFPSLISPPLCLIRNRYLFPASTSADSVLHPPKWDILFKGLWRHLPSPLLGCVKYIPTREYQRFRRTRTIIEGVSRQLVEDKREAYLGDDKKSKDIMSLLGESVVSISGPRALNKADPQ